MILFCQKSYYTLGFNSFLPENTSSDCLLYFLHFFTKITFFTFIIGFFGYICTFRNKNRGIDGITEGKDSTWTALG